MLNTDVIQQKNIKYSLAIICIQHLENCVTQSLSQIKIEVNKTPRYGSRQDDPTCFAGVVSMLFKRFFK